MKKSHSTIVFLLLCAAGLQLAGCREYETYAEQKEKERKYIQSFIKDGGIDGREINVITFEEFCAHDSTTDVAKNEYVLFEDNGVYMQIVRKGEGRAQRRGENRNYLCRYYEYSIADADTTSGNLYATAPDKFICRRTGDSYSASYTYGYMYATYGSAVPSGWLVPMPYITPGRPNDKGAKVRLIVPHSEGTSVSAQYVKPYFYEITILPEP